MVILYLLILGVAAGVFISYPFWGRGGITATEDPELAGLEIAREMKYREIRDAETDLASGKMSPEDFDRVNADLRRDAVEILDQLEDARADAGLPPEEGGTGDEPASKSADS